MREFMLRCNYWASHAGTEMWRNWNEQSVRMMPSYRFKELKQRVYEGATVYISINNAVISEFEALAGLRINDSKTTYEEGTLIYSESLCPTVSQECST